MLAYQYNIKFKPTTQHGNGNGNADAMSRLPLPEVGTSECDATSELVVGQIAALPVTSQKLATCTRKDPLLSRVRMYIREGWPVTPMPALKPFST